MTQFPSFLLQRDDLWRKMGFRAIVSRRTCEEVGVYIMWVVVVHCYHR